MAPTLGAAHEEKSAAFALKACGFQSSFCFLVASWFSLSLSLSSLFQSCASCLWSFEAVLCSKCGRVTYAASSKGESESADTFYYSIHFPAGLAAVIAHQHWPRQRWTAKLAPYCPARLCHHHRSAIIIAMLTLLALTVHA